MQIEAHLRQLEESLLDPATRKDPALVASHLADDFIEFGSSGRSFDKASIIEELKDEPTRPASLLSDFAARPLSPDVMLVTYRSTRRSPLGETTAQAQRSSIWVQRDGRWKLTFHQGTPIPLAL